MSLTRFGISLEEDLLKQQFENFLKAIPDLVKQEWDAGDREIVGAITLVYSHDTRELTDTLTDMQHHFHNSTVSSMHVHLDEHNCLEVLVVRGKGNEIKKIADRLIGTKGVKHGKLTVTSTGKKLT